MASKRASSPNGFRFVVVPIDRSPLADPVLGRVALLPLAESPEITLLHVLPASLPVPLQRAAQNDAQKAIDEDANALRARLSKKASIQAVVKIGSPAAEIARCAASTKAELIVMGRGGGRTIRDMFLGSTAERVIRRGQRPVLAVRVRPRAAYRRPAIALDFDQAAAEAVAVLLRLIPPPRGRLPVIHAYEPPYYGRMSEEVRQQIRDQYQKEATEKIVKLLSRALARAKVARSDAFAWTPYVAFGDPRDVIKKVVKQTDSDLLVLGTRGHTGAAYVFLGSMAGNVLRDVDCDTLVVPPRRNRSR